MKHFACIAVVIALAVISASEKVLETDIPIVIPNQFDVIQPDLEPDYRSILPAVHEAKSCGGYGKLITIRAKGCQPESKCRILADGNPVPWEVEFIPKEDTNAIGFRMILLIDGTSKTVYERALTDSALKGGKRHVLASSSGAMDELKGKEVTSQAFIYRVNDNKVEVCAEASYEIY